MGKGWVAALCVLLCGVLLAGCGKPIEADESLIYVDKKGAVTSVDVEPLGDSYDEAELKEFVDAAVADYNAENEKDSVKVEKLVVAEGTAKLWMRYKEPQDYASFHDVEFYQGTVADSVAEGYTYGEDFVKVEDGQEAGAATKQEIYEEDGLKVVILNQKTAVDVRVAGKICYVSAGNAQVAGTDLVSVRGEDPAAEDSIVIVYR